MPPQIRKYDDLGFPVPSTFDNLSMPDRDSFGKAATPATDPASRRGATRRKRIVLGAVLLAIAALAVVPWLKDVGQGLLGDWMANRARKKFNEGDMPGTVADSTRAFSLLGDDLNDERQIELLAIRGCAKLEINDLEGSLADLDRVLNSVKTRREIRTLCYFRRAWVNCRLQNFAAGVSDASMAMQLHGREDPKLLNLRAYIRALANAGKPANQEELEAGLKDIERAIAGARDNPAFLDTRGLLQHLLGRNDEALRDMNRAIELTLPMARQAYVLEDARRTKEDLAVMFYHRGLVYKALTLNDKATDDFQRADEMGYDPDAGVL